MSFVLIVEDDRMLGRLLRDQLIKAGYHSEWADSINKATDILSKEKVDLVYLDINLGQDNGMHLLRYIKSDKHLKNISVIMLSNEGQLEKLDAASESGATDFVVKAAIDFDKFVELTKSKLPVY